MCIETVKQFMVCFNAVQWLFHSLYTSGHGKSTANVEWGLYCCSKTKSSHRLFHSMTVSQYNHVVPYTDLGGRGYFGVNAALVNYMKTCNKWMSWTIILANPQLVFFSSDQLQKCSGSSCFLNQQLEHQKSHTDCSAPVSHFNIKTIFQCLVISIIKIRWSQDHLIFIMESYTDKTSLYTCIDHPGSGGLFDLFVQQNDQQIPCRQTLLLWNQITWIHG